MGVATSRDDYAATLAVGMGVGVAPTVAPPPLDRPDVAASTNASTNNCVSPSADAPPCSSSVKRKRDNCNTNENSSTHLNAQQSSCTIASARSDDSLLVPNVFTWTFGGQHVFIAGAWDNWSKKTPMYQNGKEHMALLYVPCGEYQFKFYVDENWQCAPNLPTRTDEHGNTNNIVKVVAEDPEFDSSAPVDLQAPLSPIASYDQASTAEFSSDPPVLPPHLEARSLKPLPDDIGPAVTAQHNALHRAMHRIQQNCPHLSPGSALAPPAERPFFSHVFVDHMYQAKLQSADEDVLYLSQTSRVSGKIINTVYVTNHLGAAT